MKALLRFGTKWEVANGEKVNIWDDIWIPEQDTELTETKPVTCQFEKVSELINHDFKALNG